jgi:hypothetical protein
MKKLFAIATSFAVMTAVNATEFAASGESNNFSAEVRKAVVGAIGGTGAAEQALAAAMGAFKTSLDDAILVITKKGDKYYRMHSNSKYNGPVTDAKDKAVYQELFAAATENVNLNSAIPTVQKENSSGEMFAWDVIRVNPNVIVVCRHKPREGGDDKGFTAEVRKAVLGAIGGIGPAEQALAAAMGAYKISLDDAIIVLSKKGQKMYRMHSNSKYNGPVTDEKDKEVYNALYAAATENVTADSVIPTVERENSSGEMFKWDIIRVNPNVLVVCRHK